MTKEEIVVLFTSRNEENPYFDLLFDGLEFHDIKPIQSQKPFFLPLSRIVIQNNNIDVIHFDWLYEFYMVRDFTSNKIVNTFLTIGRTIQFIIDLLIVRLLGIHLVWTVHNTYHHDADYQSIEKILNVIVANLARSLVVKCDAAKHTIRDLYRVRNDAKIKTIPDGNYIDAYPNEIDKNEARDELNIGDEFVYLYFGLIRPYKGVNQLIHEFKKLDDNNVALWIVGKPKSESIRERIRSQTSQDDRINAKLEFIDDKDVQYYMNLADVLVLPYRDILNSGSVHLGLSFGKPIIAPKMGCIPSVIPEENDLLYDPTVEEALEETLLVARHVDLTKISQANLTRAQEYNWEEVGSQYAEMYRNRC